MLELLLNEIKAMQEKYERDVKILHDRIDALVIEMEKMKNV
jgi:hypothetical protein